MRRSSQLQLERRWYSRSFLVLLCTCTVKEVEELNVSQGISLCRLDMTPEEQKYLTVTIWVGTCVYCVPTRTFLLLMGYKYRFAARSSSVQMYRRIFYNLSMKISLYPIWFGSQIFWNVRVSALIYDNINMRSDA